MSDEAPKKRGRPRKEALVERISAKVLWPNVWSSKGKHMKGDVVELTASDFALLDEKDAIKRVD